MVCTVHADMWKLCGYCSCKTALLIIVVLSNCQQGVIGSVHIVVSTNTINTAQVELFVGYHLSVVVTAIFDLNHTCFLKHCWVN